MASAHAACLHITRLQEFTAATKIGLYADFAGELPTRPLFEVARASGKLCLFPVVGLTKSLHFRLLDRWEELRPGRYGVLEPPPGSEEIALGHQDLAVVPGIAFDGDGRRLGSGAGYYDRTFPPGVPAPFLVGFAFDLQRIERVPSASHDRSMNAVVTERGFWRVPRSER